MVLRLKTRSSVKIVQVYASTLTCVGKAVEKFPEDEVYICNYEFHLRSGVKKTQRALHNFGFDKRGE